MVEVSYLGYFGVYWNEDLGFSVEALHPEVSGLGFGSFRK